MSEMWGADTPISMPEALKKGNPVQVDFGGFAFAPSGLVHNVTEADLDEIYTPFFRPDGTTANEVM